MDRVIAVAVRLRNRRLRYFLTWGRTFDPVDGTRIAETVFAHASAYALRGSRMAAQVCYALLDAANAPYFDKSLLRLRVPDVDGPKALRRWQSRMARQQAAEKHLHFCGDPLQRKQSRDAYWSMQRTSGR